ncbi:MAG: hypothetical protein ACD_67C00250G0004 [uncultured bacterium]|nr:MAG: hypothetical protein ACD_67C00250G0004 [uncultured bacterium]
MNKEKNLLSSILRFPRSIVTSKDISLIWRDTRKQAVFSSIAYYVKKGELYPLRRGIYAKDKNYNRFELATRIYTPSYISFETVLAKAGIIFQYYGQIFVASYQSREISCDGQKYSFRKVKNSVLTNQIGVDNKEGYSIASAERAFLDVIYLNTNYHFDNMSPLDWKKVFLLLPLYDNKELEKRVEFYHKAFLETI